jgi:transcriptional regulator with XRE-family HTH domain
VETIKINKPSNQSDNNHELPTPLPVERAIRKIGNDISLARRRRHISQESLAERTGASISTIRRLEKGDMRVPIHFLARVLHVFGEIDALANLLDTAQDEIGLTLMDEQLPKRIRKPSSKRNTTGAL